MILLTRSELRVRFGTDSAMTPTRLSLDLSILPKGRREHEGRIVLHANREWNLHPADCAPLVKAVSGNQAPTLLKCLAVRL